MIFFYENVVYGNIFKFECDIKIIFGQLSLAHLSLLLKVKHTKTDALSLADRKIHFDLENPLLFLSFSDSRQAVIKLLSGSGSHQVVDS